MQNATTNLDAARVRLATLGAERVDTTSPIPWATTMAGRLFYGVPSDDELPAALAIAERVNCAQLSGSRGADSLVG